MQQKSFLVLCLLLAGITGFSQNKISGIITHVKRQPLNGAHIHIADKSTATNPAGRFEIKNIPSGKTRLIVSYIGYRTIDTLLTITDDISVSFTMKPDISALKEVVISKAAQPQSTKNSEKVNQNYIQESYAGSFAKSLEKLPGVNAMEIGAGTSKPIIRGLGFNRIAVTENGIKQEGQQWGADHGLEIDAFNAENVEIVKGVGAIEYGSDAMGGVISINNEAVPSPNSFSGQALAIAKSVNNTIGTSVGIQYRKDHFFYKLKGTVLDFGDYKVPTDEILYLNTHIPVYNQTLKNTAGRETDFFGQVGYIDKKFKSTLSISNVYFKSGFFPGAHGIPSIAAVQDDGDDRNIGLPYQRVNHFKIINNNQWSFQNSQLNASVSFQNNHRQEWSKFHTHYSNQQPPEVNPDLELDFNLSTLDAQLKYKYNWSVAHQTTVGIQNQYQSNTIDGYSFLLPKFTRNAIGAYAIHDYTVSQKLKLNAGIRFDRAQIAIDKFFDQTLYDYLTGNGQSPAVANFYAERSRDIDKNFSSFNASVGMGYKMNDSWNLTATIGSNFRFPTAIELSANGIHHGAFRHEMGDATLDPEKGISFDTKLSYTKNNFKAAFSPYAYYFSNYIFLKPSGQFSILPHGGQIYQYSQSEALLSGFEVSLEKRFLDRITAEVVLEYLYNRQVTSDSSKDYPLPFTPPANGYWEIGYNFKSSKIFTNAVVSVNGRTALEQDRIAQNELITPGYSIFGGAVKSDIKLGSFLANVQLSVNNAFNTKYFNHNSYYRALEIPEMGRNIQLLIRIPFGKASHE
ncbi:TonB-dependent receptor [Flavobacterium cerinum]|uniref:TonB-dependent receptor n=1 Tax=Flavobacterium cerinum TaxID=2502784 RepID=A0ABY5IT91_9FLAO|nr:TonB-dependent receptor [Flavobacterium cerinum]UUC46063.1 TonB-dependent receptor [Flavobacterium cerinum]